MEAKRLFTKVVNVKTSLRARKEKSMTEFNTPTLATKKLSARGRTYFLDLKETQKGDKYLQVTESRRGKDGQNIRNSLFLFEDRAQEFQDALEEMVLQM